MVIDYEPDCCQGCGNDLAAAEDAGVVVRQVFDIPIRCRSWLSIVVIVIVAVAVAGQRLSQRSLPSTFLSLNARFRG